MINKTNKIFIYILIKKNSHIETIDDPSNNSECHIYIKIMEILINYSCIDIGYYINECLS